MTCSTATPEQVAARLAGRPVRAVEPGGAGGNNRLYKVVLDDGGALALKLYPQVAGDGRDRLGAEFAALEFLGAQGFPDVPRAVGREGQYGLYEWVEGAPVGDATAADVDAALDFAARLHGVRAKAEGLGWASEACTSGAELVAQVETRLARLAQVDGAHRPLLDEVAAQLDRLKPSAVALELASRTLSPADFGFHNALRRPDGRLVFLDFEYFGWDDPVKLAAEFDLHPGMELAPALSERWRAGVDRLYNSEPGYAERLAAFRPLFVLRWTLIVLNEFLPERWARRLAAGATDAELAKARQLDKARRLLSKVTP